MSASSLVKYVLQVLDRAETAILAGIILFSALLLFANVLLRYLFLHPIFWAEELARYLMVWMIFLGAGKVAGDEGHISVTVVADRLRGRARGFWRIAVASLCLAFCAALTWYSLRHTLRVQAAGQVTAALEFPMWLAYFSITAGAASMTLRYGVGLAVELFSGSSR